MRNCLFVVLLAGLISACTSSGKPDNIVVTFDVKNPTATEVVLVYHRTINSVPLNEQGYGADTISGVNALYANLFYGQNERKIYLEKEIVYTLLLMAMIMSERLSLKVKRHQ